MSLEHLWAGWRLDYVQKASDAERAERAGSTDECVFCRILESGEPSAENGVVWRGPLTFAVLNAYPYASGHLLILPLRHVPVLGDLTEEESADLWRTTMAAADALASAYDPDGLNMGANLGRAAGAGIPKHVHLHVLPRWSGDTNFMTTVAGVRVLPENLDESWRRVHDAWPVESTGRA
ncbi:MAG TPA: HIT domain-containing protein [Acidimicrobiales bacterium]|nr:HIT domain-containing protein [Acidimicrobiales bacterium]